MGDPVKQGGGECLVMEYPDPCREHQVGSHHHAGRLIPGCEQLEQQFSPGKIECDVPQFVEDQQVRPLQLPGEDRSTVVPALPRSTRSSGLPPS